MEQQDQPSLLLNLPVEVVEKILLTLMLPDRKTIRLTCKLLYDLCNSERFCKDEKLVWCENFLHQGDMLSDFYNSARCHYNLVIRLKKLQTVKVLPFFQKHGSKVHSLSIEKCKASPDLLYAIVIHCEELCSLSLISGCHRHDTEIIADSGLNLFTLEPNEVTRPKVVSLTLLLPAVKPWKSFHRISSIFPNVKYLNIRVAKSSRNPLKTRAECWTIFDDIMKIGNHLESLKLNIPLDPLFMRETQFFDALPNLKDLFVDFGGDKEPSDLGKWCSCFQNINSISFHNLSSLRTPSNWLPLLKSTELNHLSLHVTGTLILNWGIFRALLSSQLKTLSIRADFISMPAEESLEVHLEFNETVTDLTLYADLRTSTLLLFSTHYPGLVHLCLSYSVKDEVLHSIFQYQENLRSLSLKCCHALSVEGFCGPKDAHPKRSIRNLKKLENLEIEHISVEIIMSKRFKRNFVFPRLKYLHISVDDSDGLGWCPTIPLGLLKRQVSLEAVFLEDEAIPSRPRLLSLFKTMKRLNYLRFCTNQTTIFDNSITFLNPMHMPIEKATYRYLYGLGQAHYDDQLDRVVIVNSRLEKTLLSPRISSFEIDWIKIHKMKIKDCDYSS